MTTTRRILLALGLSALAAAPASAQTASPASPPPEGAKLGFEKLAEQTMHDFIRFRAPSRWSCGKNAEGRGICDEPGGGTGTLWIDYQLYRLEGQTAIEDARKLAESSAKKMAEELPRQDGGRYMVGARPAGPTVVGATGAQQEGEPTKVFNWFLLEPRAGYLVVVNFSLVVKRPMFATPDERHLIEVMNREALAARIGDPPRG